MPRQSRRGRRSRQREVRTILISLMLTMFLAALDQTIVATALPTIGRQSTTSPICPG